ncbi:MAG: heme-binding protein [Agrococcus sp.]
MTWVGPAPRPGRPRPRFFNAAASYPAAASAAQAAICASSTGTPSIVSCCAIRLAYYENRDPSILFSATSGGKVAIFAGGVPLTRDGVVVGAVGVSGGSREQDPSVAEAGAAAF